MMTQEQINPHEILEIAPGATRGEIERAYYLARLAYGSDSLASYSLYSPGERTAILERIERAYRLLIDEEPAAQAGDRETGGDDRAAERKAREGGEMRPAAAQGFGATQPAGRRSAEAAEEPAGQPAPPSLRSREPVRPVPARAQVEVTDVPRPYDAHALERIRKSRGLSLEEIAAQTKISLKNLRLIESGDYTQLPPVVYLRGYLTQYAQCLRLSPSDVLADYLEVAGEAAGG